MAGRYEAAGTRLAEPVTPERVQTAVRKHAAEMGLENFLTSIGELSRFVLLTSVLREPEAHADEDAADSGHRRAQDVQELRQFHFAQRIG